MALRRGGFAYACVLLGSSIAFSTSGLAQVTPALQRATTSITHPAADTPVTGTAWLALPGETALAQVTGALYDPTSSSYHKFLDWPALASYLPTAAQVKAVQEELSAHNLVVVHTDAHNLSVTFRGRTADFEAAFHTMVEDHTFASGRQLTAFTAAPALGNRASGLVRAVSGIGHAPEEPAVVQPRDPASGHLLGVESLEQAAAASTASLPDCIFQPAKVLLATPNQPTPVAAYVGPIYGAPLQNGKLTPTGKCAYTPAQYFRQTGLDRIHAAGYTGKGQTIAILEETGSSTLAADLAAFDKTYGLAAANLTVTNLGAAPTSPDDETTLDVESAHAVAPDAKIGVIDGNLQTGLGYVLENHIADIVSSSYGSTELEDSEAYIQAWNSLLMVASSMGVNVNVCSQDYGDRIADEGQPDVDVPGDSPYATTVGGLSIFYVPGTKRLYKTSWGTDFTRLTEDGNLLITPQPIGHGTTKFGGGGGTSTVFPVPAYQAALGGTGRHLPDVSDLADGYTGLKIVITDPTNCVTSPCSEVAGGTSLATPIFAAKWALLNQLYGASLGQAAPLIAKYAGTAAVEDIVTLPEAAVAGATLSGSGLQFFSANQLASPETSQPYVSALWQSSIDPVPGVRAGDDYVISFGTDSTLAVTPGYDFATGWGELDIAAIFAQAGKTAAPQGH